MSYVAQLAKDITPNVHLVIASGGNAGFAAACAANAIDVPCTVYLPAGLDSRFLDSLRRERAHLVTGGKDYSEVLAKAKAAVANNKNCLELSAYDDPNLWRGHASMIEEISKDLKVKPDAIFCSVGGAGLLAGVMVGCETVGWDDVPIVALETIGSDCFYHSMQTNRRPKLSSERAAPLVEGVMTFYNEKHSVELVSLPAITSVASSLGASSPSAGAVKMALQRKGDIICALVPDALSMQTALAFAADHKFLVELACSTTLVPAYQRPMFNNILPPRSDGKRRTVVFIVCGGSKISLEDMAKYRHIVDSETGPWKVWVEGKAIEFEK